MTSAQGELPDEAQPYDSVGRAQEGRGERREQTRAALLGAAQRLWAERGIHGASLDDVAAAAGLTKGAVYSNFAGKTDLLLALLERYTRERFGSEVCDLLRDASQPLADRLQRAAEVYRTRIDTEDTRLTMLLFVEFWLYGMRDHAAGRRLAQWYGERRRLMGRGLDEADGIPAGDRAALALAVDIGLSFQHMLDPENVPTELYGTGLALILGPALR